jgi:hypothetical protein
MAKSFWPDLKYLEITLPKEIHKSPAAMEFLFNALNQGLGHEVKDLPISDLWEGEYDLTTAWKKLRQKYYAKYTKGSVRMWYSLEIASFEGVIKFYVVAVAKHAEIAKSYIYSQFPEVEIREVEDYLLPFEYKGHLDKDAKNLIYLGRYSLTEKDYLPIKTYVDYGLDKAKEEDKIDPLTPLLESMAGAGPGEFFFYQLLIRTTINDDWKKDTQKRIDEIMGIKEVDGKKVVERNIAQLTPREKHELEILEKNIEKAGFDVIPRFIYFAQKEKFSMPRGVMPVVNGFKAFNKEGYNKFGFETATVDSDTPFLDKYSLKTDGTRKYYWQMFKMRTGFYFEAEGDYMSFHDIWSGYWKKKKKVGNYAAKAFLYEDVPEFLFPELRGPGAGGSFVLNTEELATLFHFPGKTFRNEAGKVASIKKEEAPFNLPI